MRLLFAARPKQNDDTMKADFYRYSVDSGTWTCISQDTGE